MRRYRWGWGEPATNGLKFWINDHLIRTTAHYLVKRVFLLKNNCVYDSSAKWKLKMSNSNHPQNILFSCKYSLTNIWNMIFWCFLSLRGSSPVCRWLTKTVSLLFFFFCVVLITEYPIQDRSKDLEQYSTGELKNFSWCLLT